MIYRITPNDTLFFRSGRPFTMGSETWAEIVFPPYPSTVYGAIRTWLIFERGSLNEFKKGKFKDELGTPQEKGRLKLKGPLLAMDDTLYFSVPEDMLSKKNSTEENLKKLSLIRIPAMFISEYSLEYILLNKTYEDLKHPEGYLNINDLIDYLQAKDVSLTFSKKEEFFKFESKIGIKRNKKTLSSEESHLYRLPMVRLNKNVSLITQIEGVDNIPEFGIIQLGGEGKISRIEKIYSEIFESLQNINFKFENKMFKLYLATPAIFKKGWIPDWIDESTLEGEYKGIKIKLFSCATERYIRISGWDMATNKPKRMYKGISSGSVYYFKILNNVGAEDIKNVFHFQNISDIKPEEGFGLSLIGEVKL